MRDSSFVMRSPLLPLHRYGSESVVALQGSGSLGECLVSTCGDPLKPVYSSGMSDWKASAIKRRDERATIGPEEEQAGGKAHPKDRRRWCRGKVGVEHTPVCMPHKHVQKWRELVCNTCGKVLDYWYPFGSRKNNPKPDWVTS